MKGVKTFLNIEGHLDSYTNLEVDYQKHHKPVLIIFDEDDMEMERIELDKEMTPEDVHRLALSKGLTRVPTEQVPEIAVAAGQEL